MNNIKEYNFSDLYEMGSGISSKPEQAGHGAPFVSFSTVFNNYFLPEKIKDLMDTSEDEQEVYSVKGGDILLTRTSETIDELGMSCVVVKDFPRATFSGFVKRLRPSQSDVTYPKFMGFYLRSKFFRKTMTNNAVLTLRASLNEDIFSYLKLYIPDYETQKRIGDFLYSLNSKIEINNRINADLEAMAKTIYDYWFVQFDFPDKKGKPYKASGGKMVWSDKLNREIPEGWEVKELGTICDLYQPQTISENEMEVNGDYLVYGANGIVGKYSKYNHEESEIVVTCRGNSCGTISRTTPFSWITGNAMVVKSKSKIMATEFVYYLLHNIGVSRSITGSAQPQITRANLSPLKAVVPDDITLRRYSEFVASSVQRRINNFKENQKLTELRDWLLPMLMNGQIKIKDAAKPKVSNNYNLDSNLKPTNQYFYQTQVVAAIINASKKNKITHGEMTLAKYSYLVDKIYQVPTCFKYDRWHLGPYPKEMKKIVNNKKFFKILNNELNVVQQQKEYAFKFEQQVESAVKELASLFNKYNGKERSRQTELLATVCKVVEDIQSTNLTAVRESMKSWPINLVGEKYKNKAEKFSEEETKSLLMIIKSKGWNQILISSDVLAMAAEPEITYQKNS